MGHNQPFRYTPYSWYRPVYNCIIYDIISQRLLHSNDVVNCQHSERENQEVRLGLLLTNVKCKIAQCTVNLRYSDLLLGGLFGTAVNDILGLPIGLIQLFWKSCLTRVVLKSFLMNSIPASLTVSSSDVLSNQSINQFLYISYLLHIWLTYNFLKAGFHCVLNLL